MDLPDGWEAHVDEGTGNTYYSHEESGTTTWDLTEGWEPHVDEGTGNTYYHREDSNSTTWESPTVFA